MKLTAIEIIGFGKWQNQKIDFLNKNQLLYGENEVGKSTIYQFIQAMLFGFPAKGKRRRDYTPKNGGAYGGRLWFEHSVYGKVQVERFKEQYRGQAKVYFNDQKGDDATLAKIIYPLTKELFQTVFTFQQEQLSQLDKMTEEELQTALLSLGLSGSQQLLARREEYFKAAQLLYKGKGSQPPLNQKLLEYQELQQRMNQKEQQEQTFQQVLKELETTNQSEIEKQQALQQLKTQLSLIEKQVMNLPLYKELRQLDQPDLTFTVNRTEKEQLNTAYQQSIFLSEEIQRLSQEMTNQNEFVEQPENYDFYLENEQQIQLLLNQRYDIDKLFAELDWMEQSYHQNQQEMLPLEKQWGWQQNNPPQLFFNEQEADEYRQQLVERTVLFQTAETDLRLVEEEIVTREENLSTFESLNKNMFQKQRRKNKQTIQPLLILLGLISIGISIFIPAPIRYLFIGLAGLFIIVSLLPLIAKKDTYENEKRQWQEKLSQLDYLNEKKLSLQEQIKTIRQQENELAQMVAKQVAEHHLGRMDRLEYWTNNRNDITHYLILVKTNQELESQIHKNQDQIAQLTEQTRPYLTKLPIVGKNLKERIAVVSEFADQMEKVRFAQEYQADIYTRQTFKEAKEKQQQVMEQIQPLLRKYHIPSIMEIPDKLQNYQDTTDRQKRKKELQSMLVGMYDGEEAVDTLPEKHQRLLQEVAVIEAETQELQKKEQRLIYQRQQMIADGTLDELYQVQATLKAEIEELAIRWSGYQLSGQLLMDLLTELSEKQLPNLLKKATDYFQILTNQIYRQVQLLDGQLVVVKTNHQSFMIHELSTGTRDQLIMAVRFAFLDAHGQQSLCPIIVDDGWLHYDSQRKQHLAKLFAVLGHKQQVICFSSDQEMVSYYQELEQPIIELEGVKHEKNS